MNKARFLVTSLVLLFFSTSQAGSIISFVQIAKTAALQTASSSAKYEGLILAEMKALTGSMTELAVYSGRNFNTLAEFDNLPLSPDTRLAIIKSYLASKSAAGADWLAINQASNNALKELERLGPAETTAASSLLNDQVTVTGSAQSKVDLIEDTFRAFKEDPLPVDPATNVATASESAEIARITNAQTMGREFCRVGANGISEESMSTAIAMNKDVHSAVVKAEQEVLAVTPPGNRKSIFTTARIQKCALYKGSAAYLLSVRNRILKLNPTATPKDANTVLSYVSEVCHNPQSPEWATQAAGFTSWQQAERAVQEPCPTGL